MLQVEPKVARAMRYMEVASGWSPSPMLEGLRTPRGPLEGLARVLDLMDAR